MALDESQKAKIRRYLGYPSSSVSPNWLLEGAMDTLTAAAEVEVEDILAQIAGIDQQATANVAYAHLKRAEDVEFYQGGYGALMGRRDQLIHELANILGVERMNQYGAGGGPCHRG